MATLNGAQAGDRLLSFGTVTPGTCLNAVWRAFGSPKSDGRYPYATATQALKRARELGAIKGYDINTAPEGAVLFWSNVWGNWKSGYGDAGHIAIKGPNNTVTTIDLPIRGRVGRVKPSAIWKHIKFEGWALGDGAFLGHAVTSPADLILNNPAPAAGAKPSPLPTPVPVFEGDSEMQVIKNIGTGQYFGVKPGYIKSFGSRADAQLIANVHSTKDEIHELTDEQFRKELSACRIPLVYATAERLNQWGPKEGWWSEVEDSTMQARARHEELVALLKAK